MNLDEWLAAARADADRRGLPELKPILDTLAKATRALRAADWNMTPEGPADRRIGCTDAPTATETPGRS